MGGRGATGGSSGGLGGGGGGGASDNSGSGLFSIPKFTTSQLNSMSRSSLETLATSIFANNHIRAGGTRAEGIYRAKSLMSGNTTAQLRKYIARNG